MGFLVFWLAIDKPKTKFALALPGEISNGWIPLKGYVWTDTVGWLNFNYKNKGGYCVNAGGAVDAAKTICSSDLDCPSGYACGYWVAVNENSGELDGYAWSEHVGWVAFRKTGFCLNAENNPDYKLPCEENGDCDSGNCNKDYVNPPNNDFLAHCSGGGASSNALACYDKNDRKFYGWGRVLSLSSNVASYDSGWVKLDGTSYGVEVIDKPSGDFDSNGLPHGGGTWGDLTGWAWSGSPVAYKNALGWFSFNCANTTCASSNYKITGQPDGMSRLTLQRLDGNDSDSIKVDWVIPVYGASSYDVWRKEEAGTYQNLTSGILSNTFTDTGLDLFTQYNYVVRACNIFGCSRSTVGTITTSPIERVGDFKATPICITNDSPATSYVDLFWGKPNIVNGSFVSIGSYQLEYCQTDATRGKACAETDWQPVVANCDNLNSESTSCREILTQATGRLKSQNFFVYRLRAKGQSGTCSGNGQLCGRDSDCLNGGTCGNFRPAGTCVGGANNGARCSDNSGCPNNSEDENDKGSCEIFASTWAFSNVFRVCPVDSAYQEKRPN
jgi:hypothetical protein